jgi:hypothetical protein
MDQRDLDIMLEQMIQCGKEFERKVMVGERYLFLNMVNAMQEIHRGWNTPAILMWGRGRIPRGLGRWKTGSLPQVRRRSGRSDGDIGQRRGPCPAGAVAERAACASAGTVSVVLGKVSVRWRLPS